MARTGSVTEKNAFTAQLTCVFLILFFISTKIQAEQILLKDGIVHTASANGHLNKADVLIKGTKIIDVGANLTVPADTKIINVTGKNITPGLMNANSFLGLSEMRWISNSNEHSAAGSSLNAAFDVRYGYNSDSLVITDNRRYGLTRSVIIPSSSGKIFHGQGAIIALDKSTPLPGPVVAKPLDGGNRSIGWKELDLIIEQAHQYADYIKGKGKRPAASLLNTINMEALAPLTRGEKILFLHVSNVTDIRQAIAFKEKHGLKIVLAGAAEAWVIANEIAKAEIPVIVNPDKNTPMSFDSFRASFKNAAILADAGVLIAIAPAFGSHGSHHMAHYVKQLASIAVAHGLDRTTALQAITSNPAQIFGIDDAYGTLEAGKDADIVVWDGDPLEAMSQPDYVFIKGKQFPLVSRRTVLRDKYHPLKQATQ